MQSNYELRRPGVLGWFVLVGIAISNGAPVMYSATLSLPDLAQCSRMSKVEFAADLLLAAMDSDPKESTAIISYLRDVYRRIDLAKDQFPTILVPGRSGDSASQFRQMLSDFGFDRTSIGLRIVNRLRVSAPQLSRQLLPLLLAKAPSVTASCSYTYVSYAGRNYYGRLLSEFPDDLEAIISTARSPQQIAGLLGDAQSRLGPLQYASAINQAVAILSSTRVSDRVFATLDSQLHLGSIIAILSRRDDINFATRHRLAEAYITFVNRQLREARCDNSARSTTHDDPVARISLSYANSLARTFSFSEIKAPPSTSVIQAQVLTPMPHTADAEAYKRLQAIAVKVREGGLGDTRKRFTEELRRFLTDPLNPMAPGFDFTSRVRTVVGIIDELGADESGRAATEGVVHFISQAIIKDEEPVAWIVAVRFVLSLTRDANTATATAAQLALQLTKDSDLAMYTLVNARISLVPGYTPLLQSRVGQVMSPF